MLSWEKPSTVFTYSTILTEFLLARVLKKSSYEKEYMTPFQANNISEWHIDVCRDEFFSSSTPPPTIPLLSTLRQTIEIIGLPSDASQVIFFLLIDFICDSSIINFFRASDNVELCKVYSFYQLVNPIL